ncbi:MAG: methyl-accepting chemotaxis protein [Oceanospirillaceae bacterium]|nr:methyl-accepting chemotaxis protein [Oceanospirillaceae bacterium]MBT11742.1 methyl-accepting chemotaxis protein [Oceanospirillaceae bacterium]|tara:strand:- start:93033 stop:94643 length:1611 start_codon:yes stop_codon:yes gene_type:complete
MKVNNLSIQHKVYLALGSIFLLVLIVVISVAVNSERNMSEDMAHSQLKDKASGYLDTMNMLMISGAIANREMVRTKLLSDDVIVEARMIRAPQIDKFYGKGLEHEYPRDELEERALQGEETLITTNDENGHIMTLVTPVYAYEDYRGTNCLGCHQAEDGDVLGAIRISYSLHEMDAHIFKNMLRMGLIQAAMFIAALIVLSLLLRKVVITPVRRMHQTLTTMDEDSDLTQTVAVSSNDEIGSTGRALNHMIEKLSDSLRRVVQTSAELEHAAQDIDESSSESLQAAQSQKAETSDIQRAIEELHESIRLVMENAEHSSEASAEAKVVAHHGVSKTDEASANIQKMNDAIQTTTGVITSLDEQSNNVGGVLEVIKGIAEQTNLLALNAAIEAARAGESGRGFAVVADEVRSLSQRTHESTQEIEAMVEALQSRARDAVNSMETAQTIAGAGSERVKEAAEALHSMTQHVDRMSELNAETLKRMQSQVELGQNVSRGIDTISQHSLNTEACAEKTTAISKKLVTMANHLTTMVGKFRL